MNKVILKGRLTREVETRYAQGNEEMAISRISIAVNRKGKDKGADFINCVAFGKSAEFLQKYFTKGQEILISGRIQVNGYTDKDGNKRTSTDVVIEEIEFCGGKGQAGETQTNEVPDEVVDDDLPF